MRRLIVLAVLVGVIAAGVVWLRGGVGDDAVQAHVMLKTPAGSQDLAPVQDVLERAKDAKKAKATRRRRPPRPRAPPPTRSPSGRSPPPARSRP